MNTTVLIGIIIAECALLLVLALLRKWTRKVFAVIAVLTAVSCALLLSQGVQTKEGTKADETRRDVYIGARLLQEHCAGESLEALSGVPDTVQDYNTPLIRALALNLNEAYETANGVLSGLTGDDADVILQADREQKDVDGDEVQRMTQDTIDSIGASDDETRQWEAQMKVRYLGLQLSDEEAEDTGDELADVSEAIREGRTEDAYDLLTKDSRNDDVKNAVIVSNMVVENYNRRDLTGSDPEYAALWQEVSSEQADINEQAAALPEDADRYETNDQGDQVPTAQYQAYLDSMNRYNLKSLELTQEAAKRAIRYLQEIGDPDGKNENGKNLQMAYLLFVTNEYDDAATCLDTIFDNLTTEGDPWLGREILLFEDSVVLHLSDAQNVEYLPLFDSLMGSLNQGIFGSDSILDYEQFRTFVMNYLEKRYGGLIIRKVDASKAPDITVYLTGADPDVIYTKDQIGVSDSGTGITDFTFEQQEVHNLSLGLVLDHSGSMSGESIEDSRVALKNCISSMRDDVSMSFVIFDDTADLMTPLTDSKVLIMSQVDKAEADGGTNINSGLEASIESLQGAVGGNKVIILLSDGYDFDESKAQMPSTIARARSLGITIYTIGLEGCDEAYLRGIAEDTGGEFIMVNDVKKLNEAYESIQNAVFNNYVMTYTIGDTEENRYLDVSVTGENTKARKIYRTGSKDAAEQTEGTDSSTSTTLPESDQMSDWFREIGGTGK